MDYYKVLGVSENASSDEIKKAYRKLSLKHHPDRKGDVETFKKINEAYQTLGDEQKRNMYKMRNKNPFGGMNGMNGMNAGPDLDPILKMFFGGGLPGMRGVPGMPGMRGGMPGMPHIQIFRNGQPVNMTEIQKPQPIIKKITISLEQAYTGFTYPLEIERWITVLNEKRIEKEKLYVNISKGVDSGEIIIIKDMGNSVNEKLKGDIKLFINVENNTIMKREGINLKIKHKISLKDSLTGFKFDINHINGNKYTINNEGYLIPSNYLKEVNNLGMMRGEVIGKLIIEFIVVFPEKLTEEQIAKLKEIL